MSLPGRPRLAITALNFGREPVEFEVDLGAITAAPAIRSAGRPAVDAITGDDAGAVGEDGRLAIALDELSGSVLIVEASAREAEPVSRGGRPAARPRP